MSLCLIDKKLHIGPAGADGALNIPNGAVMEENEEEDGSPAPGPSKFTPQDEGGSNNILVYVSVLAAVVLGLLVYVAYKWWVCTASMSCNNVSILGMCKLKLLSWTLPSWRSCKQKKALSKARVAELAASPEGEKLQSDSGVFLDSYSLQDNQPSKGKEDTQTLILQLQMINFFIHFLLSSY